MTVREFQVGHSKNAQMDMTVGRLYLDTKWVFFCFNAILLYLIKLFFPYCRLFRTSAMELVRCRSYELDELSASLLNFEHKSVYPNEIPEYFTWVSLWILCILLLKCVELQICESSAGAAELVMDRALASSAFGCANQFSASRSADHQCCRWSYGGLYIYIYK